MLGSVYEMKNERAKSISQRKQKVCLSDVDVNAVTEELFSFQMAACEGRRPPLTTNVAEPSKFEQNFQVAGQEQPLENKEQEAIL